MSSSVWNFIPQVRHVTYIQLSELACDNKDSIDSCSCVVSICLCRSHGVLYVEWHVGHSKRCSKFPLKIFECANSWCDFSSSWVSYLVEHSEQGKTSLVLHLWSPCLWILCDSLSEFGSWIEQIILHIRWSFLARATRITDPLCLLVCY